MSLVELKRFGTPVQADLARLRLQAAGIEAIIFDADTLYASVATGVRLMVADEDEAEARLLLEE